MTDEHPINPETGQPYERRSHDRVMEKRLDEATAYIRKVVINAAILVIGVGAVIALIFAILFTQQSNQADRIQRERYDSLVQSCQGQNGRHDEAIRRVDRSGVPEDIQKQRKDLIDALQPRIKDCKVYATQRVKE